MLLPGLGIIRIRYNGYNLSLRSASTPVNRGKDSYFMAKSTIFSPFFVLQRLVVGGAEQRERAVATIMSDSPFGSYRYLTTISR